MTNMQIKMRRTGELHAYGNNARQHSKQQLAKLKSSIEKFGWTNPLIIDETGMILCGHGRFAAANELGIEWVPTVEIGHMTEAQKRAYIIADNKLAEESSWSKSLLRSELKGLADFGLDLELTGFGTLEIDALLSFEDPEPKVDDDVQLPDAETPVSQVGDLWDWRGAEPWQRYRLVVGDARDPLAYERLMDGERSELVFVDPPYGCAIAGNVSGLGKVKHGDFVMGAGESSLPEFAATILRPAFRLMAQHSAAGTIAFVCTDWRAAPHLQDAALGVFDELKNLIVWVKTNAGMGTFYRSAHELIFAYKMSPGKHINNFGLGEGGRHRSNVWTYPGANTFRAGRMEDLADHSTVKPKRMVADAILDCSRVGGIVLDPFAGSGTTLVAAAMTRRRGYGIEIDPKYADVIIRRVTEQVGIQPTLEGVPFEAVAAERREAGHGG